ncbi:MAG: prepilin peptidase leader peptidase (prepilin peptidase) / N-methyltransferase [Candidatus Kaiserbacteria bacterium]|nr:prepilin peptidase leader peptidase (prepilin peptidase) / N-methyltransferase [Candidatus Kaiserbacteria bacterium]
MTLGLVCGLFGLIAGSFLNVVILRHGAKSLDGRSQCMSCGVQLKWYDLVPVISWVALRGKCRACHSSISIQYPLVELASGVSFVLIGTSQETFGLVTPFYFAVAAFMIVIAAYDIRHTIIPDEWAYMFAILAAVTSIMAPLYAGSFLFLILAGPLAALPLFLLWLVSGGSWMGLGDAKLALGIGWLLGPVYGPAAIMGAFVIGAVISVGILLPLPHARAYLHRLRAGKGIARLRGGHTGLTMTSEVAFGPFLVASAFLTWMLLLYHVPLPL